MAGNVDETILLRRIDRLRIDCERIKAVLPTRFEDRIIVLLAVAAGEAKERGLLLQSVLDALTVAFGELKQEEE